VSWLTAARVSCADRRRDTFIGALKGFLAFGRWAATLEQVTGAIIGVGLHLIWLS
jgi:hypothetical protein